VVIPYGPEKVTSYELGSKNRFLDNSLQLNLAAYYLDYKDQQVSTFVSDPQGTGSRTVNAGASEIYGLEANIDYATDAFGRLSISANYLHARYESFLTVVGWNTSINQNLAGNRLPLSPTLSTTVQYERPISLSSGATLTPGVNVKYESAKFFQPENYASSKQDAYALLNATLKYEPADANWSIQGYVNNITDEVVLVDAGEFYTGRNYTYAYQPPRTYGLRVAMDF
jgi:iron complex outermembrane receptor protein